MVSVRAQSCRDQDFINSKLRPNKRRFPRGPVPGSQAKMKQYGRRHLRYYKFQKPLWYVILINTNYICHKVTIPTTISNWSDPFPTMLYLGSAVPLGLPIPKATK